MKSDKTEIESRILRCNSTKSNNNSFKLGEGVGNGTLLLFLYPTPPPINPL